MQHVVIGHVSFIVVSVILRQIMSCVTVSISNNAAIYMNMNFVYFLLSSTATDIMLIELNSELITS